MSIREDMRAGYQLIRNEERLAAWTKKRENAARRNFTPRIFTNANCRVLGVRILK